MRKATIGTSAAVLLSALALAGCSNSSAPKSVTVPFKSPALASGTLPARYTCDGKNIAPPLEWGAVPSTTRELALFVLGLTPVAHTGRYTVSVEWAVAGVNPALHRLAAGELPPGAHVGRASNGKKRYSICPRKGTSKQYQFALYAIPASVAVAPRFVGLKLLQAVANPSSALATNVGGAFVASYKRA